MYLTHLYFALLQIVFAQWPWQFCDMFGQVMFTMSCNWDWSDCGFPMIRPGHRYRWGRPQGVDAFTRHQGSVVLFGSSWQILIFHSWWGSACLVPLLPGWSDLYPFHIDALAKKVTTDGPHFESFDISFPAWWDSFLPFLRHILNFPYTSHHHLGNKTGKFLSFVSLNSVSYFLQKD